MARFTRIGNDYCSLINIVLKFQLLHLLLNALAHDVFISGNVSATDLRLPKVKIYKSSGNFFP